jgi:hypothetical protein
MGGQKSLIGRNGRPGVIDMIREGGWMPALGNQNAPAPDAQGSSPQPAAPKPKAGFKETFSGLPGWAWVFIVGCLALPVVNLGGAIPGALGFGGAAGCANVAKKTEWETTARVLVCSAITGGIWIAWLAVAVAIVSLQN